MDRYGIRGVEAAAVVLAVLIPAPPPVTGTGFGSSLASIADLNGDGKPDLLVGCPTADGGQGSGAWVGKVVVISGANGKVIRTVEGDLLNEKFGTSLAPLGDVNGDAVPDFAVGAPLATPPPRKIGSEVAELSGRVVVVSGKDGTFLNSIWGAAHEQFGTAVAALPDRDGDGVTDLLVGAPLVGSADLPDAGSARVVSTKAGKVLFKVDGGGKSLFLGSAVASLADLDGDGIADLGVGGPSDFAGGEVRFLSGKNGTLLRSISAQEGWKWFGRCLVGCGDLDRDGVEDVAASAPGWHSADWKASGLVVVFSGKDGASLKRYEARAGDRDFGASIAPVGDIDGDGVTDLCIGAPETKGEKGDYSGTVRMISGAGGDSIWEAHCVMPEARLGHALACLPDMDGDGKPDVALGAPGADVVLVVSGKTGSLIRTLQDRAK